MSTVELAAEKSNIGCRRNWDDNQNYGNKSSFKVDYFPLSLEKIFYCFKEFLLVISDNDSFNNELQTVLHKMAPTDSFNERKLDSEFFPADLFK